ncbi:hypothetical protein J2W58_000820 [Pseudomonas psychrotolerans]|nr:hypothetical protein [Pseudomonas psychrotolerans]
MVGAVAESVPLLLPPLPLGEGWGEGPVVHDSYRWRCFPSP